LLEAVSLKAVELTLTEARHLSAEQAEAVRHAANRDGVGLIEAGAGTGKTTAAQAIVRSAHLSGIQVIGLAPSWQAADELSASAGIPAQAIARWRFERAHSRGAPLHGRSLILVDEAGMVGTRDMEAILSAAQAAGAKVLLVGDRRQLASVAGASALRAVAEVVERSAAMEAVRRQAVDWQRAASVLMARGDSESGLRAYAVRGEVELVSGLDAARARVVEVWTEQRAAYGDDVLIVTRRNRDATTLNRMAREVLRGEGRLGPDLATLPTIDRKGKAAVLSLAVGDRLRFGETLPILSIRNGNRATVTAIKLVENGGAIVRLQLDDGREIEEPWKRLAREPLFNRRAGPPRITHAIAGTAYAAQGRTACATTLAIFSSTDAREIYVGLTRHRHAVRIVVERDRLDALCRQRQADPRDPPTATAILERLYKEARQYSEKANVADYAEDRVAFAETGRLRGSPSQDRLGVERALRGAHLLRISIAQLHLQRIIVPLRRIIADRDFRELRSQRAGLATLAMRIRAILHKPLHVRRIQHDIDRDR
jgi:ATP-dependent exoDNAse (exonuclease V) alpha subunit